MNEELLDTLREIADPAKCKLPEGWKGEINQRNQPVFGDYATTWAISGLHVNNVMDLLGRLSRAIEVEGLFFFERNGAGRWFRLIQRQPHNTASVTSESWKNGERVASEALALAKCIRAACAVEVITVADTPLNRDFMDVRLVEDAVTEAARSVGGSE